MIAEESIIAREPYARLSIAIEKEKAKGFVFGDGIPSNMANRPCTVHETNYGTKLVDVHRIAGDEMPAEWLPLDR
jgi:hypothetical protein